MATNLSSIVIVEKLNKIADVNWDVFLQDNDNDLSEIENQYVHVSDIADGHHGQYTFDVACERLGVDVVSESDAEDYFMMQDFLMSEWAEEIRALTGRDGYDVIWYDDGSISIVYSEMGE